MSKIMYKDKQILGCISDAKYAAYDNTGTGLSATNAQDAITELNGKLEWHIVNINSDVSNYSEISVIRETGNYIIAHGQTAFVGNTTYRFGLYQQDKLGYSESSQITIMNNKITQIYGVTSLGVDISSDLKVYMR